jgi:hypothetical protein
MADSNALVALEAAYRGFLLAIQRAQASGKPNDMAGSLRHAGLIAAAEGFVQALQVNKKWADELRRRAAFVETGTCPGSAYATARQAALRSWKGPRRAIKFY